MTKIQFVCMTILFEWRNSNIEYKELKVQKFKLRLSYIIFQKWVDQLFLFYWYYTDLETMENNIIPIVKFNCFLYFLLIIKHYYCPLNTEHWPVLKKKKKTWPRFIYFIWPKIKIPNLLTIHCLSNFPLSSAQHRNE